MAASIYRSIDVDPLADHLPHVSVLDTLEGSLIVLRGIHNRLDELEGLPTGVEMANAPAPRPGLISTAHIVNTCVGELATRVSKLADQLGVL